MTAPTRRLLDREPPGPAQSHELGDTDQSLELMARWFAEYGDTYRVYAPSRQAWTWVVHHPDDVKRVLVSNHRNYTKGIGIDRVRLLLGNGIMTSEGEFWRRQRRAVQATLHRRVVEHCGEVIRARNDALLAQWAAAADGGTAVNLTLSMSELALDVVVQALFGDDLAALVGDRGENPFRLVTRETRRDPRFAFEYRQLGKVVQQVLRWRRTGRGGRRDFVQLLLEWCDPETGCGMTERELLDEILTLVVAGHETTASALTWTWWLLSQHADVERRLHEEQDRVGDLHRAGHDDLARLRWSAAVVREALRLYPPGWLLTRRAQGPDRLGGYAVPSGTDVLVSPYLVHRHPGFWDNPDAFDPERFEPARSAGRHRFAYLPFGAGPRLCVGESFATFEMMLHLNAAARRFRLRPVAPGPVALEARINLRPAQDIHMRVERR